MNAMMNAKQRRRVNALASCRGDGKCDFRQTMCKVWEFGGISLKTKLKAHAWDNAVPIEETMRTFDDLVRCGKIRYYRFSTVCGWQLQKIVNFAKYSGLNQSISLQQHYSLLCRKSEWEEFMVCKNEGIGVLPWSPLKGGLLTGKFKRGETPDKTKSRIGFIHTDETRAINSAPAWSKYAENEVYWNLLDVMEKIAVARGAQIIVVPTKIQDGRR